MIKTTAMLLDELKEYTYPANKLSRMVENKIVFPVVRGLYVTDAAIPGRFLSASLYGPSYLSFDYALSYWNLIPEGVFVFTSATYDKKKKKRFETPFGSFHYRDVPKKAYPLGILIVREGDSIFFIAEPEKALCDKLYTLSPVKNQSEFHHLLFNDLRIELAAFEQLDTDKLNRYASLYQTRNHRELIKFLRRIS